MAGAAPVDKKYQWNVFDDKAALGSALGEAVAKAADDAVKSRGRFHVAISGGSLPSILAKGLAGQDLPAGKLWTVWFADERCVPASSDDSNEKGVQSSVIADGGLEGAAVEGINLKEGDSTDPTTIAKDYEARLLKDCPTNDAGMPVLDLVLLGMGPDGHTASLFPGHALLGEATSAVAAIADSPKPPSQRITLTYPTIKAAHGCWFVVTGAGKQEAVKSVRSSLDAVEGDASEALPAGRIRGDETADLRWFLDVAANGATGK